MSHKNAVMYYLVNNDLKMGKGKLCAQIGHATVKVCLRLEKDDVINDWFKTGETKIALKSNFIEMEQLYEKYRKSSKFWCVKIVDQGKTQIPKDSFTVLAFRPVYREDVVEDIVEIKNGKLL